MRVCLLFLIIISWAFACDPPAGPNESCLTFDYNHNVTELEILIHLLGPARVVASYTRCVQDYYAKKAAHKKERRREKIRLQRWIDETQDVEAKCQEAIAQLEERNRNRYFWQFEDVPEWFRLRNYCPIGVYSVPDAELEWRYASDRHPCLEKACRDDGLHPVGILPGIPGREVGVGGLLGVRGPRGPGWKEMCKNWIKVRI